MSFLASFTNSALQFLLVYCWHIADEPLLPHLHGLMRPVTIAAVMIICLYFEYKEPGKSELVCIPRTLDVLTS